MSRLQKYLKSLNPKKKDQHILIYGSEYHLWRNGKYLGIATWTKDLNVGDSFQVATNKDGKTIQVVIIADRWKLKKKNFKITNNDK